MLPKQDLDYGLEIKEELYKIVDLAFSSRRKNIKNNLKSLNIDWESLNIDPRKRSEEISLNNFIKRGCCAVTFGNHCHFSCCIFYRIASTYYFAKHSISTM